MSRITPNHREVLFVQDSITRDPFAVGGDSSTKSVNVKLAASAFDDGDTATVTSIDDTDSSTTLISANSSRKKVIIFNDSSSVLYIKYGNTASSSSFTDKLAQDEVHITGYRGRIDGIWSSNSTGAARITET